MSKTIPYDHALEVAAGLTTNAALKATLMELRGLLLEGGFLQCAGKLPNERRCRNYLLLNDARIGLTTCRYHRGQEPEEQP